MLAHARRTLLVAVMLGCAPKPPVLASDTNLVLRGPEDELVCGGTFARSSAEVAMIRESFRASTGPVEYVWMPQGNVSNEDFPCDSSDFACAIGVTVYTRTLASTHELVHAARSPGLPRILEEGLATLLEEPTAQEQVLAPRPEFEEALTSGAWIATNAFYERSAHFMSFLVTWGGREAVRSLEDTFAAETDEVRLLSPEALDEALITVYGAGLADILIEYESYPDCAPARFHQPISTCSLLTSGQVSEVMLTAEFGAGSGAGEALISVDCGSATAYGPVDRGPLTVAEDAKVELELPLGPSVLVNLAGEAQAGATVWLSNCGDCWSGSGVLVSDAEPSALVNLEPGPHVLTVHQAVGQPGELGLQLSY